MTVSLVQPFITPLIRRHVEDAAFYWLQHDISSSSPRMRLPGLARFSALLLAHLEGLDAAGNAACAPAWRALERWKKPGEAFVAAYIALNGNRSAEWSKLWPVVLAKPDQLLRGVIGALAWLPPQRALQHIRVLSTRNSCPAGQVAALRALCLLDEPAFGMLEQPLDYYLSSNHRFVRAAAWRVAARLDHEAFSSLGALAVDEDNADVRGESALACALQYAGRDQHGTSLDLARDRLLLCVSAQARQATTSTGWNKVQATRRLTRWSTWLAVLFPIGCPRVTDIVGILPPRARLSFIAAHGDPTWLSYVVEQTKIAGTARLAGWTWETLTGINLETAGLVLENESPAAVPMAVTEEALDGDIGLLRPNSDALANYRLPEFSPQTRILLGHPISDRHAFSVLQSGTQAERLIAQHHLLLTNQRYTTSIRASAERQQSAILQLAASLSGKKNT